MSRRRKLSAEEERLWKSVTDTTTPIEKPAVPPALLPKKNKPKPPETKQDYKPPAFRIGEKTKPETTGFLSPSQQPVRMDQKAFGRMKRGKSKPDARIDLHGMTAAAAQARLTSFLMQAHADQKRLVLVITGKGKAIYDDGPVPRRAGILRQQVPMWLERPPLRQIVLQVVQAHQKHGGLGAFYVYLNRRR